MSRRYAWPGDYEPSPEEAREELRRRGEWKEDEDVLAVLRKVSVGGEAPGFVKTTIEIEIEGRFSEEAVRQRVETAIVEALVADAVPEGRSRVRVVTRGTRRFYFRDDEGESR